MDTAELAVFDDAATRILADAWGNATAAGNTTSDTTGLDKLWQVAASVGWLELADYGALDALMSAVRATGRAACPLPLADTYIALDLISEHNPGLAQQIRTADLRPIVVATEAGLSHVEAADAATHVLVLGRDGPARLAIIGDRAARRGVPVPAASSVTLGQTVAEFEVSAQDRRQAISVLRLALAGRAIAAAGRAHELAVEHACVRVQFGKPIGSFGAVQQRAAESTIDISSTTVLLDEAVRLAEGDPASWELAVELAVQHARISAPKVQFGSQHTLAAVGFFEEHEAPWLFRRVHTDCAAIADLPATDVADQLIELGRDLPSTDADADARQFRAQIRSFFADNDLIRESAQPFVDSPEVLSLLADGGYLGLTWPTEFGGQNLRAAEQSVLMDEVGYGRVAAQCALNGVMFFGEALLKYGTPAQREQFLPLLRNGQMRYCLGYSEPETGSDLAGLITRAARDGDDWVVNGQKTWTTRAHESDWIWLAVRTDPDRSKRHGGITMFLVPLSTPGITIDQHRSQVGEVSCSVFFDDVRIPDSARVGDIGGGWAVITTALAGERVALGAVTGTLRAIFDDLLELLRADPALAGASGSAKRAALSRTAAHLQAARLLVRSAIDAMTAGSGAKLQAPMAGVAGGELAEEIGMLVPEILGPQALFSDGPDNGVFAHNLLLSIKYVVGGGTNDVLRGLISRSLGLPR